MLRFLAVAVTVLFSLIAQASDLKDQKPEPPAFELKGVYPGQDLEKAFELLPGLKGYCQNKPTQSGSLGCYYQPPKPEHERYGMTRIPALDTFGGQPTLHWLLIHHEGKVQSASVGLPAEQFTFIREALVAKYGKPTKEETSQVQSRAGATYDQSESTWTSGDYTLTARKRAGKVSEMRVTVRSISTMLDSIERAKDAARANTKDL